MRKTGILLFVLLLMSATSWAVPVTVSFEPESRVVAAGTGFGVDVIADIPDPIIAFGLDLLFDETLLVLTDVLFGPRWTPVSPPGSPLSDGEGFGALLTPALPLMPPGGISGNAILLFTLTFDALAPGLSGLDLGATPGDLSEGFALATGGFADVNFVLGTVEVVAVPEPATWLLMLTGLLLLVGRNVRAACTGSGAPRVCCP